MDTIIIISSILLWLVVGFNVLLTLAIIRKLNSLPQPPQQDLLKNGTEAPDFYAQSLEGHNLTKESFSGKEMAMVFVSSHCGPCRDQMPKLEELYPKAKKAGTELLIICLEDLEKTQAFVNELNFTAPLLSAPAVANPINENYKVPGTPSYYLIDKQGKIKSGGFLDDKWQEITKKW